MPKLILMTKNIIQVLKDSGVFEYTWTELELWLDQLARVEADQQETVIQFLERVRLMSIQRRQSHVLISRAAVLNLWNISSFRCWGNWCPILTHT